MYATDYYLLACPEQRPPSYTMDPMVNSSNVIRLIEYSVTATICFKQPVRYYSTVDGQRQMHHQTQLGLIDQHDI